MREALHYTLGQMLLEHSWDEQDCDVSCSNASTFLAIGLDWCLVCTIEGKIISKVR